MKQHRLYTRIQTVYVVVTVPENPAPQMGPLDVERIFQRELSLLTDEAWQTVEDSVSYMSFKMEAN